MVLWRITKIKNHDFDYKIFVNPNKIPSDIDVIWNSSAPLDIDHTPFPFCTEIPLSTHIGILFPLIVFINGIVSLLLYLVYPIALLLTTYFITFVALCNIICTYLLVYFAFCTLRFVMFCMQSWVCYMCR